MKPILLTASLFISCIQLHAQEIPHTTGTKTTGAHIVTKNTPQFIPAEAAAASGGADIAETIGELSVSGSGAAAFQIPIALPPGIAGVLPELSLTYNSQGGSGLAGWGWNVTGVSAITRVAATQFYDGRVGNVGFTSGATGDRFALDGQRLLLKSGAYGADGSVYETELFSNLRVTAIGVSPLGANYGPAYFRVDYPDGSQAIYGNGSNSRTQTTWAVTYRDNPRAIRINYEYTISDNTLRINKIRYGSAGAATPINEVQFLYNTRSRTEQSYIGGVVFLNKHLLKEIRVLGSGGAGYRSYIFTHNTSSHGYDRLVAVQEKSGDGTLTHAPVNFSYTNTASTIGHTPSEYTLLENVAQNNAGIVSLDYNGDGTMEFIVYPTTGTYAYKKFWFLKDFQQQGGSAFPITEYGPLTNSFVGMFATDLLYQNEKKQPGQGITLIQNSGATDVVFNVFGEAPVSSGIPIASQYQKTWTAPKYSTMPDCGSISYNREPLRYVSGDFNGDGLTDVLAISLPYSYSQCAPTNNPGCPIEITVERSPIQEDSTLASVTGDSVKNKDGSETNLLVPPPPGDCCSCSAGSSTSANMYFINLDRRITSGFANFAGSFAGGLTTSDKLLTADVDVDGKT